MVLSCLSKNGKKLLLSSICRPLGPKYGDGKSVGYELLFGQVTRAQGIFSPRATHVNFSLEYIANNLEIPTTVLQYPSKRELVRELKKGYDYVGLSFILATFHRLKESVALVRQYSPKSKIILGGYGTVLKDDVLKPYCDYICREEGVAFMRNLLEEPELPMPYKHPLIESRLKVFSVPVSTTGMIFGGLGCPHGCDFCCTSHFFKRKHIRLLPTGQDIYNVVDRYLKRNPRMGFTILDEDFLLNKKRALAFRDCVVAGKKPLSLFVFASIRSISQYTVQEILEMGIDGFWIGYEGTRSGYNKQKGLPVDQLMKELKENGITILASMIVGFDYQTPEVVAEELAGLMEIRPDLAQFLIYGPTPGTAFYKRVIEEGLMHQDYLDDSEHYYHSATGFHAMVKHPTLTPQEVEDLQEWCFEEDFQRLGPSIYRVVETWLKGYQKWKESPSEFLQKKAAAQAKKIRQTYPMFLAGRLLGPNSKVRGWIRELEQKIYAEFGAPTLKERLLALAALGAAGWTSFKLRYNLFQHPRLARHTFRMTEEGLWSSRLWESIREEIHSPSFSFQVDLQHTKKQVWLNLEGIMDDLKAENIGQRVKELLAKGKGKLVLDFENLKALEGQALETLAEKLKDYRKRIRIWIPEHFAANAAQFLFLIQMFRLY